MELGIMDERRSRIGKGVEGEVESGKKDESWRQKISGR